MDILDLISEKAVTIVGATVVGLFLTRVYFQGGTYRGTQRMDDKTVIITGANTGIGKETARDLAARGARVIMACRSKERCKAARDDIVKATGSDRVVMEDLDLGSLKSIREFAERINKSEERIDVVINNAGLFVPGPNRFETEDGFEMNFGVNHLGHFLLTHLLLDKIKASAPSRVVNVSSSAHRRAQLNFDDLELRNNYDKWIAYGNSKLANILHARELARRLDGTGVVAVSLHPGVVKTDITRNAALHVKLIFSFLAPMFFKNTRQGAQTSLHCAIDPSVVDQSGEYFSDCAVKETAANGKDKELAKKLWEASEKLLQI